MSNLLCDSAIEHLKDLKDSEVYSDENFKEVLSRVNSICKSASKTIVTASGVQQEKAITSIFLLITEACRQGLDAAQLNSLLQDIHFSNTRIALVVQLFESVKLSVLSELDSKGSHHPFIVGANWSLDYCAKDSSNERVNALEFLIDLETQGVGGTEGHVQVACNVEEMQDLVGQLREAVKHMEKMASG